MFYFKAVKSMNHHAPRALVRAFTLLSILVTAQLLPQFSYAEYSIIVHPSNQNQLSPKQVQRIFLGRLKTYPNHMTASPVDQPINSRIRQVFSEKILKKNTQKIKSYWARQIFTGKGTPPKALNADDTVKAFVGTNENAIGYIETKRLDSSVKEILEF